MNKNLLIICRFSILINHNCWILNGTLEEKKMKLFDKNRLESKFWSFENLMLESLINQKDKNFTLLVFSSVYLPDNYKERLQNIIKDTQIKVKLYYINENIYDMIHIIKSHFDIDSINATMRIDDDDALNPNFISILNEKYINKENINKAISFPNGLQIMYNSNHLYVKPHSEKNIAIGLTYISDKITIFELGDHPKIHNKVSVIYDYLNYMYLLYSSPYCDTKRILKKGMLVKNIYNKYITDFFWLKV